MKFLESLAGGCLCVSASRSIVGGGYFAGCGGVAFVQRMQIFKNVFAKS